MPLRVAVAARAVVPAAAVVVLLPATGVAVAARAPAAVVATGAVVPAAAAVGAAVVLVAAGPPQATSNATISVSPSSSAHCRTPEPPVRRRIRPSSLTP